MRSILATPTLSIALLAGAVVSLSAPASAQPERVEIGTGVMTVGYELKTTTHGDGPEGRTKAHGLMKYIIPVEGAGWSEAERATVNRWSSLSIAERTAFFFGTYKGGHNATNFQVDTQKYPFLDKSVSWYGSMNIPHIEVRSNPYENPKEALANMKALRADVKETIAFHMHLRFPDTSSNQKAEALTEWLRRTSWAVALKRADYSPKTDFVLKSMDNQPINIEELNKALNSFSKANPTAESDIIERRGIRVSRLGSGEDRKLDIEFRGLMRDTGRLEAYLKATAETFKNGSTSGSKTVYDANHPMRDHSSRGVIKFRTFGWHGKSAWEVNELNWLAEEVERSRAELNIRSSIAEADRREAVKRLATADTEGGKKMLLPSSFNWLFLPLEYDPALPERVQEEVAKQKKRYVTKLIRLAERVHAGEFGGKPGAEGYRPMAVATRTRRILHDFMNEKYTDAGKSLKLFEWYEMSVFKPKEIEERTERYRAETGKNRAEEWKARAAANAAAAEGFGRRRANADRTTPLSSSSNFPTELVKGELEAVRRGMLARLADRIATEAVPAEKAKLEAGLERLRNVNFTLVAEADVFADAKGREVRLSHGLLNQILAQTANLPSEVRHTVMRQALGLIAGHEVAHVAGIRVERVADAEAVRAYEHARGPISDAAIRAAVGVFTRPVGFSRWNNFLNRLKSFARYGTEAARLRGLQNASGEDPLRAFRRADGTLDWKRLSASRALTEVGGLAHFGLALFLKEIAAVAATGDKARMEEFFDGLMTTDFYKHYGLFVAGARVAEVGYVKYLQRYVRPGFVNSMLKTNLVLAAGLALPSIAEGTFDGKVFAISLGSLGLSSAAVKAGVSSIKWVYDLKKTQNAGALARLGLRGGKFMRAGGWFYTAVELAVVLYLADEVGQFVNEKMDEAAAKEAMREAGEAWTRAAGDPDLTAEEVREASERYHAAWIDYRNYLYRPMHIEEARYAERLERVAREAKIAADRRAAALEKLERYPALRSRIVRSHGSVERYAQSLVEKDEAEHNRKVTMYTETYLKNRDALLKEIYNGKRRDGAILDGVENPDWLLRGATPGAAGDPWNSRRDIFSRMGRARAVASLGDAFESVSPNRLQAYEDERAIYEAAAAAAVRAGQPDRAAIFRELAASVEKTRVMDRALINDQNGLIDTTQAEGAKAAIDRIRTGG